MPNDNIPLTTAVQIQDTLLRMDHLVSTLHLHQVHLVELIEGEILKAKFERQRFSNDKGLCVFLDGKLASYKEVLEWAKGNYETAQPTS